jgi:hypothetical protein
VTYAGTRSPRAALAWLLLIAACIRPPIAAPPIAAPPGAAHAGVSIVIYQGGTPATSYGVVDDRRWIELEDHELVLDQLDPGASLASLVIEPLEGGPLAVERCAREAWPSLPAGAPPRSGRPRPRDALVVPSNDPVVATKPAATVAPSVRCSVRGASGRRLVRIFYVSHSLTYATQHDLAMAVSDRAELATRFTFATPGWHEHAEVVLFDGAPGGEHPPSELVRGAVELDGSIAIFASKPRVVAARLVRIYDGAIATVAVDPSDVNSGAASSHFVWVWIELADTALSPGPMHARIEVPDEPVRELDLPATLRASAIGSGVRVPLWPDDMLRGTRERLAESGALTEISERLLLSISNLGEVPREVWVEEHARKARHLRIDRAWPKPPLATGDIVRATLEVKPHAIERAGYTVTYEF